MRFLLNHKPGKLLLFIVISQMAGGDWLVTRTCLFLCNQLSNNVIYKRVSFDNSRHEALCSIRNSGIPISVKQCAFEKNDPGIVDPKASPAIAVSGFHYGFGGPSADFITYKTVQFHKIFSAKHSSRAPPLS